MNEQWQMLKETIIETRNYNKFDNKDVTLICQFLVNYMNILEKQTQKSKELRFAKWVANEIFSDTWEFNKDAFDELACRKLAKLGLVKANGDEWELVESEESEGE